MGSWVRAFQKQRNAIVVNTSHKRNAKVRCLFYRPYIEVPFDFLGHMISADNSDASQNDPGVTRCRNKMNHCCDFRAQCLRPQCKHTMQLDHSH